MNERGGLGDLTRWRTLMGRAVTEMLDLAGATVAVHPGWWLALSGLPSADLNMVLIHAADEGALEQAIVRIDACGCPALLLLAGGGQDLAAELPPDWTAVGAMPIMTVDLSDAPTAAEPRVRRARAADAPAISSLMSEAYGIDRELVVIMVSGVLGGESGSGFWVLEQNGEPVSTVLTSRVEDTVSLWCMATPPRFSRRGYGRTLLAAVLHWAAHDGASVGLLGATPAGEPLYRATGWTVIDNWDIHLNASSAQFS